VNVWIVGDHLKNRASRDFYSMTKKLDALLPGALAAVTPLRSSCAATLRCGAIISDSVSLPETVGSTSTLTSTTKAATLNTYSVTTD
jgi:hypothetical protein